MVGLPPVQQLAHHQLLLLERSAVCGGNVQACAAVVITSS